MLLRRLLGLGLRAGAAIGPCIGLLLHMLVHAAKLVAHLPGGPEHRDDEVEYQFIDHIEGNQE